ncbi:hypothetical protein, partial [Mycobacterium leprae]|uniref:hypothetical protein n=1 Tax=Mycobacterium leprae TaxID=1769 RepID=UPI001E28E61D
PPLGLNHPNNAPSDADSHRSLRCCGPCVELIGVVGNRLGRHALLDPVRRWRKMDTGVVATQFVW